MTDDHAEARAELDQQTHEPPPDLDAAVAALARLKPLEYDRVRQAEAERLGVRVATLDAEVRKARGDAQEDAPGAGRALVLEDPEPWHSPVDGASLLNALAAAFARFLVLAEGAAEALALWTLHTHAHDAARVSPILAVTSPQKRCGKTKTLDVLGPVVRRPLPASNITSAALFRATEVYRPTLLIDEADTFLDDADELRGILNSGHSRSAAFVIRTVGDDHEPRIFTTWAPKAIAKIGRLSGTLFDRSIPIRMARKLPADRIERLTEAEVERLRDHARRAARWVNDNFVALRDADPPTPVGLHDRAADNWRPLLAIADVAGGGWPDRARVAIARLADEDEGDEAAPVLLLADVRDLFAARRVDRLPSADLADALSKLEERPWPEWKHGKAITQRQVAILLRPFRIVPTAVRMPDGKTPRGYHRDQFADAWRRYLPQDPLADPQHRNKPSGARFSAETEPQRPGPTVADADRPKPNGGAACCGVADRKGEARGGNGEDHDPWWVEGEIP
jgi:putative DNA primase/helicase